MGRPNARFSKRTMNSDKDRGNLSVFLGLIALRLINALSILTFFQPDEYYQSLEPAWQSAFGKNSGAWITWEWREHLRSSVHPLLFAAIYKATVQLCNFIRASPTVQADILIAAPKFLQAVIAAAGDYFTWRLARQLYGAPSRASLAALALTTLSPWQWFCSVRTLSNSLETSLTVAALSYWPWHWFLEQHETRTSRGSSKSRPPRQVASSRAHSAPGNLKVSLITAALACILRPTNVIIWAVLSLTLLCRHGSAQKLIALASNALFSGLTVIVPCLCLDQMYYGEWVFPPLKFLYFNVVQSLAVFYGRNRVDYYFTEGLPLLLTTALPFAIVGLWQSFHPGPNNPAFEQYIERQSRFVLATTVCVTVLALTVIAHKEVRFIYPLLPILHILTAKPLVAFFDTFPLLAQKAKPCLMVLVLALNIGIAAYVSLVHQRGVIDVLHYLRHQQEARLEHSMPNNTAENITVGFLMPCHSTPWRSHLVHPNIHAWALTCEPPLHLTVSEREGYLDEADVFYTNPAQWLNSNMRSRSLVTDDTSVANNEKPQNEDRRDWPTYLVFFEQLELALTQMLETTRYKECWRGFNTHWHDDSRRQGDVIVWCMRL